jgi:hypothetical protein
VLKLLKSNQDKIADEIRFLQDVFLVIGIFIDSLNEGISITEADITVTEMPEKRLILGGENTFTSPGDFLNEFLRFRKSVLEPPINMSYPVGGCWPNMAAFLNQPSFPTRFFSLDPKGNERRPKGLYLNGYTRGYYGQTNDLPERMKDFAKKNGLRFTGEVFGTYLFDEISVTDTEQYLLQISATVTETRRVPSRRPSYPRKRF